LDDSIRELERRVREGDASALPLLEAAWGRTGRGWFGEPLEEGLARGAEKPLYLVNGKAATYVWPLGFVLEGADEARARLAKLAETDRRSVDPLPLPLVFFLLVAHEKNAPAVKRHVADPGAGPLGEAYLTWLLQEQFAGRAATQGPASALAAVRAVRSKLLGVCEDHHTDVRWRHEQGRRIARGLDAAVSVLEASPVVADLRQYVLGTCRSIDLLRPRVDAEDVADSTDDDGWAVGGLNWVRNRVMAELGPQVPGAP
jgi:hypothetical protein